MEHDPNEGHSMNFMRAAMAGNDAAPVRPKEEPTPLAKPPEIPGWAQVTHQVALGTESFTVKISLPLSYNTPEGKSEKYNVVYILDEQDGVFSTFTASARNNFAMIRPLDKRQWFPEFIVATAKRDNGEPPPAEFMLPLVCNNLVPLVDSNFRTNPYAAGRALCGFSGIAKEMVYKALEDEAAIKTFNSYLAGVQAIGTSGELPTLPEKFGCFLAIGTADGEEPIKAAKATKAALEARAGVGKELTDTVMQVDRYGEQHYRQEAKLGAAVHLEEVPGKASSVLGWAFAEKGALWLGERLEAQKLERLGGLLPWHEFK